jgi:hypothetical protein
MKKSHAILLLVALIGATPVFSQKIKLIQGDLSSLKGQTSIATQFVYDGLVVGKNNEAEADYVKEKTTEYNNKTPGKGDTWAKAWVSDRSDKYEPRFNGVFTKEVGMTVDPKAKYTLIVKTVSLEPGFNVGVASHSADITGEAWLVETANPSNIVAKLSFTKAPGRMFGADFDTGIRIQECYATAARALGKFMSKS